MKKHAVLISLIALAIVTGILFLQNNKEIEVEFEAENEEKPDQPMLTGEEKAMFLDYLEERQQEPRLKSASMDNKSSYAAGKITGAWSSKLSQSGWFGYRVDNSAYDSLRNVFYVASYAGHLYKLDYEDEVKWTLLNHKIQLNPPDNNSANPIFLATLLPDSTCRLLRSNDDQHRMEYSDDEGISWNASSGARVTRSWSNQAFEITNSGQKQIVLHTYDANYHRLYFSSDNGATYSPSSFNFPISTYDVRIVKPFFTNDAYLWVWRKGTKKISVYKYNPEVSDYELVVNSASTVAGTNLSSVAATFYNGTLHFYLSTINSNYTIYYSNDGGATWSQKNAGRDKPFETLVPNKPNILLSGFEDIKISVTYGASWIGMSHKIGWDLQHMRTYETSGNKTVTLAGLDFGCYISETPQNKDSYKWCNNGAWYAMHYDVTSGENFNSIYMGNQDRGTTAYLDSGEEVNTVDVDGTDVLRVAYSNHETSVWSWFYYGRIKHRFNFATGKTGEAVYDGLGNWWAAPIIASPDLSENAIYSAYGSNLQKFEYNASTNSIAKTAHPFNFKTKFGDELGGFGYSELNRNIWYAALNNGSFLYSEDAGQSWTKSTYTGSKPTANDQSYNYPKNQMVIRASQIDTNRVFYAGIGNRFLMSPNNGKSFVSKSSGLNVSRIRDFALSPDEKFIFAACGYGGAWVYSLADNFWYQMSDDPIPSVDFTDVEFIHRKNVVRFGTYGSGIIELALDQQFYQLASPSKLKAVLNNLNQVELNWDDNSENPDGFYIERAIKGDFVRIDTIGADETSYTDKHVEYDQTCYYRVKAFKNEFSSFKSNLVYVTIPKQGYLNQANWTLVSASSEEITGEYAPAKYAFDGNAATFWHTAWKNSQPKHPHSLVIDLGEESTIAGFRYLPRQDGNINGSIAKYEFYVSNNKNSFGTPIITGTFASTSELKEAMFNWPINGRYVKLVALSEVNGKTYTSAAEIAVLYQQVAPDSPVNFSANPKTDNSIILRWQDNSINASGIIIEQLMNGTFISIDSVDNPTNSFAHKDLYAGTLYTYRIRAYNDGGVSAPTKPLEATTSGTNSIQQLTTDWNIYPNPCTTFLNISLSPLANTAIVKVIDINGKIVISRQVDQGVTQLSLTLSDLPKGNYIIELSSNDKRTSKLITKQ